MDVNKQRGKGKLHELYGFLRKKFGQLTGNRRMQAEGEAIRLEGKGRQNFAKGVGQAQGAAEDLAGNVKQGLRKLTGDGSTQASGVADEASGKARKEFNR